MTRLIAVFQSKIKSGQDGVIGVGLVFVHAVCMCVYTYKTSMIGWRILEVEILKS